MWKYCPRGPGTIEGLIVTRQRMRKKPSRIENATFRIGRKDIFHLAHPFLLAMLILHPSEAICQPVRGSSVTAAQREEAQRLLMNEQMQVIKSWRKTEEAIAYLGGAGQLRERFKNKLSPGGKIYFLACSGNFAEALKLLDKLPQRDTGSGLYLRAVCLDGMQKHLDAVASFSKAKAKVGKTFNPGFRFYLHNSTAQIAIGQRAEAAKNLKEVAEKSSDALKYSSTKFLVANSVVKRLYYLMELDGKFKEAFDGYLDLYGNAKNQMQIEEPQAIDDSIKARAAKWLREHPTTPPGDKVQVCKYLTTKAKAQLAVKETEKAKSTLLEAVKLRIPTNADMTFEFLNGQYSALTKAREVAGSILLSLDVKINDYKAACKHCRAMFLTDPANEMKESLTCVSMKDIAEVLTPNDAKLHSEQTERQLDFRMLKNLAERN